jgi:hypothetical protein
MLGVEESKGDDEVKGDEPKPVEKVEFNIKQAMMDNFALDFFVDFPEGNLPRSYFILCLCDR